MSGNVGCIGAVPLNEILSLISAARLFELSEALSVPVQYFYEGLSEQSNHDLEIDSEILAPDVLSKKETMDLVRAYYQMEEGPPKHLLDLAKSLSHAMKAASSHGKLTSDAA